MAKHKKPAPAAKKPTAKPTKASKPVKAVKKVSHPVPAKKSESSAKPADKKTKAPVAKVVPAKPEPVAPVKKPAAAPAKAPEKVAEKKPTGKTTPPVEVKAAPSKSTPPIPTKPASTGKTNPPMVGKVAAPAAKPTKPLSEKAQAKADAREALRSRILGARRASKPIALTMEEVREMAKTAAPSPVVEVAAKPSKAVKAAPKADLAKLEKPAAPNHIKAASLADILGFNPKKAQKVASPMVDPEEVPEKFRRYYKILLDLRAHILEGLNLHTEETLKRSAKDDAGDLSSYGQHMADAGTDTFDRDFALSLVSSEQEALTEIEAAIKRIHDGTYGVCEVTGKPIAKDRLLAVPFTRYSAEAQKEIEKNRMRTRSAPGLFGEIGEEGGRIADDDGGGDE